ncbi:MAG TPA: hypothetical protein VFZ67_09100 [Nitrososphaera sp.]
MPPSNECSQELNVTVEDNGDITDSDLPDSSSTNEAEEEEDSNTEETEE